MRRSAIAVAALVLSLLVTGCAPTGPDPVAPISGGTVSSPTPSSQDQALPPAIVSPADLAGTEVSVSLGSAVVLAVADGTEAEWAGTTLDRAVAEFSAGGPSEGAVFRPGFIARALGTTAAAVTGPEGQEIAFTISVVAP